MKCQSLFSWKIEKNISKCHLLKILPRVLSIKVCINNSRMSLCIAKRTKNLYKETDLHAHSEPAHQWSDQSLR